jgi:hypothetical protein
LRFPYKKYPSSQTGSFFYVAVLPVSIALPDKNSPRSKRFEALIDSGASSCIFQAEIGRAMGLDIEKGNLLQTLGVAGPSDIYMHEIAVHLPGGIAIITAGFADSLPVSGLLGMSGFFEHFRVCFDPIALGVELDRIFRA